MEGHNLLNLFLKETALSFFFLLLEPVQCLGKTFFSLFFAQPHKMLSKFSKLSAIFKPRGKNSVMMMSIVRLASNKS